MKKREHRYRKALEQIAAIGDGAHDAYSAEAAYNTARAALGRPVRTSEGVWVVPLAEGENAPTKDSG